MFGDDFYPTPTGLIDRMLGKANMSGVSTILEPSAGRGDIIERIRKKQEYGHRESEIDAIELDPELQHILTGKGCKPVATDFLDFESFRAYDLIIMNPPFSTGDKHLLHALRMQRDGGQVVCLLNAETIRNPYTHRRQELVRLIEDYGGEVEYIQAGFQTADRKTDVEVALISVTIPPATRQSDILKNIVEARELADKADPTISDVVEGDGIYGAVKRYEVEVSAGLKFIDEYEALRPILSTSFRDKNYSMIELLVDGQKYGNMRNALVNRTRMKYWQQLFKTAEFGQLFTSKTRQDYNKRIADLARYEFNVANIKQMQIELSQGMLQSLDDAIVRLFDEFSSQYWDEQSNNIHYYNGWKTNKAYIINRKVITRKYCFTGWDGRFREHEAAELMDDIHKVFAYLDGELSTDMSGIRQPLNVAERTGNTRGVQFPYCKADFFKKGTAHITFKDVRLLKKFNLIGSQRKGWLPPAYGQKPYSAMTSEEQSVVDDFEGAESYRETVENYEFYLQPKSAPLTLPSGLAEVAP